jgi:ABC-type transport system involved in multi-copper enzyme maturation permease subunit
MASWKKTSRWRMHWPLLGKELQEQAARRQLYIVRVIYAVTLFSAFGIYYVRHLAGGSVLTLGHGAAPFHFLVGAQVVAIYLFLPPLMAGAVAAEKERETLGLLFLTDLTPWELILQKYFGRLIPMLSLLFLSLPLMAVTYSLGGVSVDTLFYSAIMLFLTCLWVGAVALQCSAHEATTFQALVRCWGICLGFMACCAFGPFPIWRVFLMNSAQYGVPPGAYVGAPSLIFPAILYLVTTWLFLVRARQILEERAFVARQNPFGYQFKQLDQYWKDLRKLTRAWLRKHDAEANELAAEIVKRAGGSAHGEDSIGSFVMTKMQVPNLLAFGIIVGVIALIILTTSVVMDSKSGGVFYLAIDGLWILGILTIPIQSTNAVASERINERLGAILTTPLPAREIIEEWLGPVQRWIQFLIRPLFVVVAVEALVKFLRTDAASGRLGHVSIYVALSIYMIFIYPVMAQWFCFWLGLVIHNQVRALMTSFLLMAAWCIVPLVLAGYAAQTGLLSSLGVEALQFISPIQIIRTIESIGMPGDGDPYLMDKITAVLFHLVMVGVALLVFRKLSLDNADRHLGRV